jgi:hypothetical protein
MLSMLLTTEGLLFAALTIGVSLATGSMHGSRTIVRPAALAASAAIVLGVLGTAAVAAWSDLFLGANWPDGWNHRLEAGALLVAIVAQPLIALVITIGVWRR